MPSLRHLFRQAEIGNRLRSYISPFINLFKSGDPRRPPVEQILTKQLDINAGFEVTLENPDKFLENKSKDIKFYDTLMTDDKIKSCVELKKRMALSSPWDVVPASDEEADEEIAEFCRWQFEHMIVSFDDHLDNFLDAMVYGYKVGELLWMNADMLRENGIVVPSDYEGRWFVGNIRQKHSVFFDFKYDEYGNVEKMVIGRNYGEEKTVSKEDLRQKFIVFSYPYPKDGNYYGDSDLKEVYPQWFAKYNIFRFRNQYLERYGMPLPEVVYDSKRTSSTEKNEIELLLKNMQDCMYLLVPGTWDANKNDLIGKFKFTLHEARNGRATKQYEDAIDQIDKQIARKLLIPDKLGFSETTTGSYSIGETQLKIFNAVIEDLQKRLETVVNRLIVKIVDFNYPNVQDYPTFQFDSLSEGIKVDMLKTLIEKGVVDKREQWIRKYVGIPQLDEKEKEQIDEAKEEDRERALAAPPPQFPPQQPQNQPKQQQPQNQPQQPQGKMKYGKPYVDFKAVKTHYDEAETEFIREFSRIWVENTQYLVAQVKSKKIVEDAKLKEIEALQIKKTELKRLLQNYFTRLYLSGRVDAIEEIKSRWNAARRGEFKRIEMQVDEYLDKDYVNSVLEQYGELGQLTEWDGEGFRMIKDMAYIGAGNTETQMLKTVSNVVYEGVRSGRTLRDVSQNITKYLSDENKKYATVVARTGASNYYNTGRMNLFASKNVDPFIEAFQYTAVVDMSTTEFCLSHDGQIIQKNDPQLSTINPPNHFQCRSLLLPVFVGEAENPDSYYYDYESNPSMRPWGTDVPVSARNPAKGFGG